MIRSVASKFRTTERDDLEAELACRALQLKIGAPAGIRNWRSYLAKMLYNKAANWIRDLRWRERKEIPIFAPSEEEPTEAYVAEDSLAAHEGNEDIRMRFAQAWDELDPEMRRLWTILVEEDGNKAAAAKRLGKHRNTVQRSIRNIRRILERHDFQDITPRIPPNTVTPQLGIQSGSGRRAWKRDLKALEERRLQAVAAVSKGLSQSVVSRRLNVARQTVSRWVKRHREFGIAGLAKARRAGRKSRMNGSQKEHLVRLLLHRQNSQWTSPRVTRLIKREFGIVYHPGHVWKILEALGWDGRHRTWKTRHSVP